jgi:uncharacterized protein
MALRFQKIFSEDTFFRRGQVRNQGGMLHARHSHDMPRAGAAADLTWILYLSCRILSELSPPRFGAARELIRTEFVRAPAESRGGGVSISHARQAAVLPNSMRQPQTHRGAAAQSTPMEDQGCSLITEIEMSEVRPPLPPFTRETAIKKVRAGEDAWNSCDPERVSLAYTVDSKWRNRSEIFEGRSKIVEFLSRKWNCEPEYRLIKELWAFTDNRIAVRFAYEYRDDSVNWFRAYGNENWEFAENGLMRHRHASINDLPIKEAERKFHWDRTGPRPAHHPGLSDLGL